MTENPIFKEDLMAAIDLVISYLVSLMRDNIFTHLLSKPLKYFFSKISKKGIQETIDELLVQGLMSTTSLTNQYHVLHFNYGKVEAELELAGCCPKIIGKTNNSSNMQGALIGVVWKNPQKRSFSLKSQIKINRFNLINNQMKN